MQQFDNNHAKGSDQFGPIISVYTKEQAIEDKILLAAGRLFNRNVIITANLIGKLKKEDLLVALVSGLRKALKFTQRDLKGFAVGNTKIWIDDNGHDFTLMLPQDY